MIVLFNYISNYISSRFDVINKSGAWYAYGGTKIAQGREAAKTFLADNPEIAVEIEHKIKAKVAGAALPEPEPEPTPAPEKGKKAKAIEA